MQNNIYTAIKPFIIFLSCMGIIPHCFKNNKYTHSLYVAVLVAVYLAMYYFYYDPMASQFNFQQTLKISEKISMTVTTIQVTVTLFNSIIGKENYFNFTKTMLKCEHDFKKVMHMPYKLIRRQIYIYAALWVFLILINCVAQFYFNQETVANRYTANNIKFGYVWILNCCVCIFAIVHISEIKRGFCVLNEFLTRMQKNNTWDEFKHEQLLKLKMWKPDVENLARIGSLHLDLCDCIRKFNNALGVLLVVKYLL